MGLLESFRRRHRSRASDAAPSDPGSSGSVAIGQSSASTDPAIDSQDTSPLRPTTDSVLGQSKFRVLVVGKSGVGKSSLINAVFRANDLTRPSANRAVEHDIDQELTSPDNDRLILHDSQGFVGGDIRNLRTVQDFIKRKSAEREPKDRLHAIWLCCEIPSAGGRVFEEGDEILLKDEANNVPIIVVFTKYDRLVMRKKKSLASTLGTNKAQWEHGSEEAAMQDVKLKCEKPLITVAGNRHAWTQFSTTDVYKDTIEKLIELTMNSIVSVPTEAVLPNTQTSTGEGTLDTGNPNIGQWLFGSAQRGSVGTKITTSIDVGRHQFWTYMFSGTLTRKPIEEWLRVIHDDIVNVWNFHDPNHQCLKSSEFRTLMVHMLTDLNIDNTTRAGRRPITMGPLLVSAAQYFVADGLISWFRGMYQKTPETLRYLMGYVIDIIIVMGCLFILVGSGGFDRISPAMVNLVLVEYCSSPHKRDIHNQIKKHVDNTTLAGLKPTKAIGQITELVKFDKYKDLQEAITAKSKTLDNTAGWITTKTI